MAIYKIWTIYDIFSHDRPARPYLRTRINIEKLILTVLWGCPDQRHHRRPSSWDRSGTAEACAPPTFTFKQNPVNPFIPWKNKKETPWPKTEGPALLSPILNRYMYDKGFFGSPLLSWSTFGKHTFDFFGPAIFFLSPSLLFIRLQSIYSPDNSGQEA